MYTPTNTDDRASRIARGLARRLRDAGLQAVASGQCVTAGGEVWDCAPGPHEGADAVYDRIVARGFAARLASLTSAVFDRPIVPLWREPDLQVIATARSVRVIGPFGPVADVSGSRIRLRVALGAGDLAANGWQRDIEGNFLVKDARWHYAARCVRGAARLQLRRDQSAAPVMDEVPAHVSGAEVSAMHEASRRLRTQRTIAYGHIVRLFGPGDLQIRLDPLWRRGNAVELDLAVRRDGHRLAGALILDSGKGALPLRLYAGDDAFVADAWQLGLRAAAELLCVAYRPAPPSNGAVGATRNGLTSTRARKSLRQRQFSGRPPWLSQAFTPTASTARAVDSYVVGHMRQLLFGQTAGSDAVENAHDVGIILPAGFTWVRPHARGLPPDAALEFYWDGS